jgi:hypothetical protein
VGAIASAIRRMFVVGNPPASLAHDGFAALAFVVL